MGGPISWAGEKVGGAGSSMPLPLLPDCGHSVKSCLPLSTVDWFPPSTSQEFFLPKVAFVLYFLRAMRKATNPEAEEEEAS